MNRRIFFSIVLVACGDVSTFTQSREDTLRAIMQTVKIIRHLEETRFEAMEENNLTALDTLLADDLSYVHTDGKSESKREFLERLRSGELRYKSIEVVQMKTRVLGNAAVVTGRARVRVKVKNEDRNLEILFTDVYALRDGRWQMVAWQSTRVMQ